MPSNEPMDIDDAPDDARLSAYPTGVKCPNHLCAERFLWDWEADEYRCFTTRDFAPSFEIEHDDGEERDKDIRLQVWQCPKCRAVLGIGVNSEFGFMIYNHPDWLDEDGKPIDWELDENAYPGD